MKQLFTCLTLLVSLFTLVTSCEKHQEDGKEDSQTGAMTITLTVSDINHSSAKVQITPSDLSATFFAGLFENAVIKGMSEEEIIEKATSRPTFESELISGQQWINLSGLTPSTDYTFIAFGYADGTAGALARAEFSTPKQPTNETGGTFTVENIEVKFTSIEFDVVPDLKDQPYVVYTMEKRWYDEYAAEGPDGAITHAYYGLQNLSVDEGFNDIGEYMKEIAYTGNSHVVCKELKTETEYVTMIFYVNVETKDPTDIYDRNFYEYKYKTLAPTGENAPTMEIKTDKYIDKDGKIVISINVKGTNVVKGSYTLTENAMAQEHIDQGMTNETLANLFFPMKQQQINAILSEDGLVMAWPPMDPIDYYFAIALYNEEGACVSDGFEILAKEE